jgi:hypothetical protein
MTVNKRVFKKAKSIAAVLIVIAMLIVPLAALLKTLAEATFQLKLVFQKIHPMKAAVVIVN